jgi:DNA-binding CsgD family transcriptional regulator
MSAIDQFSSLVSTLYEAAEDSRQWTRFVEEYYTAMDSTRGVLCARAPQPGMTKVFLEGYTESEKRDYSDYYFQHDEVLTAGLHSIEKSSHWMGPLEEIYPFKAMEASEIYNDYYSELGMHYASCVMVGATGPYTALGMAAWRSKKDGAFSAEQLKLTELLTPHLKQAFSLSYKLNMLGAEAQALRAGLDGASVAAIALRANGHIVAVSPPAEVLLNRKEVLVRRGSRISAVDAAKDGELQRLIDLATRTSDIDLLAIGGRSIQPGGAMLLPHPSRPLAFQVQVFPVRASATIWGSSPAVLIFLSDPGATLPSRAQTLKDLYQLSPLETRLAELFLQGIELKQAAERLKLTYENTRFHLRQVFRKTGTTRQTELLRLLLALPA